MHDPAQTEFSAAKTDYTKNSCVCVLLATFVLTEYILRHFACALFVAVFLNSGQRGYGCCVGALRETGLCDMCCSGTDMA